ncbi:MAG: endolytic transglycosylase MltG [Candidatus Paceibacterota bacterium]|jgi:UPF0755 protein
MEEPLLYIQEPTPLPQLPAPKWWHRFYAVRRSALAGTLLALVFMLDFGFIASAPKAFPVDTVFSVAAGETLSGAAATLQSHGLIRSAFLFKALLTVFGGSTRGLVAGDYYMPIREGAVGIAWRLSHGQYDLQKNRVTIPEGFSSVDIAARLAARFNTFNSKEFLRLARPYEGYLFPDTYFFLSNVTAAEVVKAMTDNYQGRIQGLALQIEAFGKPIKDVITMASIVEDEARTDESRRMIAGILWKRLKIGMPLQVDAAFAFVNGKKSSADLTLDDLAIDSPYNTYKNRGLPPGPISNPGLAAIEATVSPTPSEYFYYLSDKDGVMHYAVTNDEHVANKDRYLR